MMCLRSVMLMSLLMIGATGLAKGGSSDGGGKGLRCQEEGRSRIYLADTFDLVHSGALKDMKPLDPNSVVIAAAELIDQMRPAKIYPHPFLKNQKVTFGWMIRHRAAGLSDTYVNKLEELDDDHIDLAKLPENCREKVQLAIQDLASGNVREAFILTGEMTWLERGFLWLHETLISLRNQPGEDTTQIREDVNAVAELMNDPALPFQKEILKILNPGELPSSQVPPAWYDDYYAKNCAEGGYSYSYLHPYHQGESMQAAFCRKLEQDKLVAWHKADRDSAIKTLIRIPAHLACKVTSLQNKDYAFNARDFEVVRVKGDGRPRSNDTVLELRMPGSRRIRSTVTVLSTQRHERDGGYGNLGAMRLSVTFPGLGGLDGGFFLDHYVEQNAEFSGDLAVNDPAIKEKYTSYRVICRGDKVEYGLDTEQSYH